jgi:hypothetical protein
MTNFLTGRVRANLEAAGSGALCLPTPGNKPMGRTLENFLTNSGIYEKYLLIYRDPRQFTLGDSGVARRRQPLYRTYVILPSVARHPEKRPRAARDAFFIEA